VRRLLGKFFGHTGYSSQPLAELHFIEQGAPHYQAAQSI
jgi:hypothetical protein